jgi:alpha-tubulin suppressor-like RCC1 family protein
MLGNGQRGTSVNVVPSKVVGLQASAVSVAIGQYHVCATLTTGRVSCWGSNDEADVLGSSSIPAGSFALTPVVVPNAYVIMGLSADWDSTCAIGEGKTTPPISGIAICWGDNTAGEGGQPFYNYANPVEITPTFDSSLQDAVTITSGDRFTCAISESKGAVCWGRDSDWGTLGDNQKCLSNPKQSPDGQTCSTPQAVVGIQGTPVGIAAGYETACAVASAGTVWCWGSNAFGQTGPVGLGGNSYGAEQISTSAGATAVAVGNDHACALVDNGNQIQCWGNNAEGELGNNTTVSYNPTPTFVQ